MYKLFAAVCIVMLTASLSFGAKVTNNAGEEMEILASTNDLIISVSPGVLAYYLDNAAATDDATWYTVSTYHKAGTFQYATAQNTTLIWKVANETGALVETNLPADSTNSASESWWDTNWDKL